MFTANESRRGIRSGQLLSSSSPLSPLYSQTAANTASPQAAPVLTTLLIPTLSSKHSANRLLVHLGEHPLDRLDFSPQLRVHP